MHENTVYRIEPYKKRKNPRPHDLEDLSKSDVSARMAIEVAHRFFQFDFEKVRFSGEARYCEDINYADGFHETRFEVTLWQAGRKVREVNFGSCGIIGTLDVDLDASLPESIHQDFIGALLGSINQTRNLPHDLPREYTCAVHDWGLDFSTCYLP